MDESAGPPPSEPSGAAPDEWTAHARPSEGPTTEAGRRPAPPGAALRTIPSRDRTAYTPTPARLGRYRVLGVLGEGGMGVVYLAEQEAPVRREVALKVLRADLPTAEVVARFERERQALALMEHPHITRVYDAGATEAGLPYIAMERVAGVPITEYADAHALPLAERLRLFRQLCGAVQHAHQKGVIHRDLKPSNVLVAEVDGRPAVKVIDFGIAKAVAPAPGGPQLTGTGVAVGTPAYMSPEQFAEGGDVDTRADIYALGVVLYELLVGALPHDAQGWALFARHATTEVPLPSARYAGLPEAGRAARAEARGTDPAALRRALAGDLDAVLGKALERDRERRYATAGELSRDLEHYLRDEPVSAARPSRAYRLRKFARRHRAAVALSAVLGVLVVAFAATSAVQARRLAAAERRAVARQAQAEQLVGFMLGDLRARLTPSGRLDVLDAVGEKALGYFAAVPERELSDAELARRAEALVQLGQVRMDQGQTPAALGLFRQAVGVSERLAARAPGDPRWALGRAHAHFWAGSAEWAQGDLDAAAKEFAPFAALARRLLAEHPDSAVYRRELAYALGNLGSAREARGDLPGALGAYNEVLALRRDLARAAPADTAALADLALAYNKLGVAHRKSGPLGAAVADHEAELALRARLSAGAPADRDRQRALANARGFLAYARLASGDATDARRDADAARAAIAALAAADPANAAWAADLAALDVLLAQLALARGELEVGLRRAAAAAGRLAPLAAGRAPGQRVPRALAAARTTEARALADVGRLDEATQAARAAVAGGDSLVARRPGDLEHRRVVADARLTLADLLAARGDSADAAASRILALLAVDSAARATGQTELVALRAIALLDLGRATEAESATAELARRGYHHPTYAARLARARRRGVSAP